MAAEKKGWKSIMPGGLTEAGSSKNFHTGDWRSKFPVRNEKCIHCLMCAAYCPDECILVRDGKMEGFNYDYCKGCGICSSVCPVHAISMHDETKLAEYQKDPDAFMKKVTAAAEKPAAPEQAKTEEKPKKAGKKSTKK